MPIDEQVRVFVYGTLKPGEANYQKYCAGKVVDSTKALALGELFALPMGFPAMTPGKSPVHGYLLSFANSEILIDLDDLEDYQPARPDSANLYYRQQIEVYEIYDQQRSLCLAWVYLMSKELVDQLGGVIQTDGWWSQCV